MAEIQTQTTGASVAAPAGTTQTGTTPIASAPAHSPIAFRQITAHLGQLRQEVMAYAEQKGPGARQWAQIGTALAEAMSHAERGRQEAASSPGGGDANGQSPR